ncbi:MAG: MotA/TolQ/ExbB proton channel family protein [bacterium]|nr:MotA/TolQ/ExbB proton channel family protein [bacterium]
MDITTIAGVAIGFFLLFTAILQDGSARIFVDIPSIMITGGGTLAAVLINYQFTDVIRILKVTAKAFIHKPIAPIKTINLLLEMSKKARRDGFIALEDDLKKVEDKFLKIALRCVVDGSPLDRTQKLLETEVENLELRHSKGIGIFKAGGKFAPAFGILGTLIGLIQIGRSASDSSVIGSSIAVAFVSTFYGVILANLIFLPIAGKLEGLTQEETLEKRLIIKGILAIQSGEPTLVIEDQLSAFLPPDVRERRKRMKEEE